MDHQGSHEISFTGEFLEQYKLLWNHLANPLGRPGIFRKTSKLSQAPSMCVDTRLETQFIGLSIYVAESPLYNSCISSSPVGQLGVCFLLLFTTWIYYRKFPKIQKLNVPFTPLEFHLYVVSWITLIYIKGLQNKNQCMPIYKALERIPVIHLCLTTKGNSLVV